MKRLYEEVAYLSYYLHWPHETILALDHRERGLWIEEVVKINRKLIED